MAMRFSASENPLVANLPSDSKGLLAEPSPAVLVTYRSNGTAAVSPVWFRYHDGAVEIVIAEGDPKLQHLDRRPECVLTVFETSPPFRGLTLEGSPSLRHDQDNKARLAITTRYLGADMAARFVEQRQSPGSILTIDAHATKSWNLGSILPMK